MYTREVRSRNEKSITAYILINREPRKEVLDVRVKSTTQQNNGPKRQEVIKTYNLAKKELADRYREKLETII